MIATELSASISMLAKQHGSLRKAARALKIDHAYLWRLKQGKKNDPSEAVLRKLGLRRIVIVTYVDRRSDSARRTGG